MACCGPSVAKIDEFDALEEQMLARPSSVTVADEHVQHLIEQNRIPIEIQLGSFKPEKKLKAKQYITRGFIKSISNSVHNSDDPNGGRMYYIKTTTTNKDWPFIFVKVYEPPYITCVSMVKFRGLKKMKQDYPLVVF